MPDQLPASVVSEIMKHLSLQDIGRLATVSKEMEKKVNGIYGKAVKEHKVAAIQMKKVTDAMTEHASNISSAARMYHGMSKWEATEMFRHGAKYLKLAKAQGHGDDTINELQKRIRKNEKDFAPDVVAAAKAYKAAKDKLKKALNDFNSVLLAEARG